MIKIALVGNPNTGKTSLFNQLTKLKQKIGNYPGVTVDKKSGILKMSSGEKLEIIDLPGIYSLNATSSDEEIVVEALTNPKFDNLPDIVAVIVDASNLKRNLLLFTQVYDLGRPIILVLNMIDVVAKNGYRIDISGLEKKLGIPVVAINARKGEGLESLKETFLTVPAAPQQTIFNPDKIHHEFIAQAAEVLAEKQGYRTWLVASTENYDHISLEENAQLDALRKSHNIIPQRVKVQETVRRYAYINQLLAEFEQRPDKVNLGITQKLDAIFTHRVFGFAIFLAMLMVVFQAVFSWASLPMEWIEGFFANLSSWVTVLLPAGPVAELIADGLIPGLAGVLVFIPQIAILFAFIALLEETGYMSRVVFLMDKIMRQFGMSGRSVVPMMSGLACAIPAVMATRTIDNWKERMTTIMVTPLMTCSARLPVYTILIALVIPEKHLFGFINLQGLVLLAMYLFGFVMAILSALVFKKLLKSRGKGYLIMELPDYKLPRGHNVGFTILEKVKSFVFEAGKIIIAISIVLWVLARFGPGDRKEMAQKQVLAEASANNWSEETTQLHLNAATLENSYMGIFGKSIEPALKPLGYDWKIGIGLLASFAAREVFVGTMATIYAVADAENELTVKESMAADINLETGKPRFTFAVAVSLLIFYALAMQCMSTLAVVYRETQSWFWPTLQFVYMTGLAYIMSLIAYQLLK